MKSHPYMRAMGGGISLSRRPDTGHVASHLWSVWQIVGPFEACTWQSCWVGNVAFSYPVASPNLDVQDRFQKTAALWYVIETEH